MTFLHLNFFFKILFISRERGQEGGRERNINVWLPLACSQLGDLAHNPGMCPDWELNPRPFGSQAISLNSLSHTSQGLNFFI